MDQSTTPVASNEMYQKRLDDVKAHFGNHDLTVGFRKLMDCVMDTQDMDMYRKAIDITDWRSKNPDDDAAMIDACQNLIKDLKAFNIQEVRTDRPIVVAENLIKSYGANRFELGPVSLTINRGQVYGLVGENGNGKTTLLRVLAKELSYQKGDLWFNFDETYRNDFDLRTHLIYIPQRTQRWFGSLMDNLKFVLSSYGISEYENETRTLMMVARFGLWNYKHLKWNELSSGYKMRFELARTMLRQPKILLLDEPLANLDVLAQQIILEDLRSICNSVSNPIALILSSQQLYEVEKVSDEVIYLKDGKQKDNSSKSGDTESPLIVEIDSKAQREQLVEAFSNLKMKQLTYNGGVYIAQFDKPTVFASVLERLGAHQIEVSYIRNISDSTKRFFMS